MSHYTNEAEAAITQSVKDAETLLGNTEERISSMIYGDYENRAMGVEQKFIGMDAKNIPNFEAAIDKYEKTIFSTSERLNNLPIEEAYKGGGVDAAVKDHIAAVKSLLDKYAATVRIWKKQIREANQNWLAAAGKLSGGIRTDIGEVTTEAGNISID